MKVRWRTATGERTSTCINAAGLGRQICELSLGGGLRADPTQLRFGFVPAGGQFGKGAATSDSQGRQLDAADILLNPWAFVFGPTVIIGSIAAFL